MQTTRVRCVSFHAAASMLAPVFPGCHVICRPATYHGIEPPPFLPSLDRRAGIEPALSLLVAGGDPGFPLVMVIVQACPRRSRQPAIWHQVTSRITAAHCQHRIQPAGHSEAPPYRARLAAAIAAVISIGRLMPHTQARLDSVLAPATFPGWSGFSVSGNQPSCCALATSTRPSLSPSHCRLVLRQHRSGLAIHSSRFPASCSAMRAIHR